MVVPIKTLEQDAGPISSKTRSKYFLWDLCVLLVMTTLLYYGVSWQLTNPFSDVAKYQCYAIGFWHGEKALHSLPFAQCAFLTNTAHPHPIKLLQGLFPILGRLVAFQPISQPLHLLPSEYPLLAVIPFSLGLIGGLSFYSTAFALGSAIIAGIIYCILKRFQTTSSAVAFAGYLVIGCWSTALARFDLVPAGLTLVALLCAERARWQWAFAVLALATLCKFYPLVLVIPFLIAQQQQSQGKWYAWSRWNGFVTFVIACTSLICVSLLLSIENTLSPFGYFGTRPIQVESLSASLLWIASFRYPLHYVFTFGSLNALGRLSTVISVISTLCLIAGLLYVWWLQWRGRLPLAAAMLLTLLITITTGKVFSPQYLIWIMPLVAYIGKANWRWLITWGSIGLLTTWIYPYIYNTVPILSVPLQPIFFPVALLRNLLILGTVIVLLYKARTATTLKSASAEIKLG